MRILTLILIATVFTMIMFWLIGSFIMWDISYLFKMGEWRNEVRVMYGAGLIMFIAMITGVTGIQTG